MNRWIFKKLDIILKTPEMMPLLKFDHVRKKKLLNNNLKKKLEGQIIKIKENLEKSENKYHKACANVELARQDWQLETYKVKPKLHIVSFRIFCFYFSFLKTIQFYLTG